MLNDRISDFLTQIRNASMAGKPSISIMATKIIVEIAKVLKSEGFIASFEKEGSMLNVTLSTGSPLKQLKRLSKPGLRRYVKVSDIPRPRSGFGLIVLSTPKGILTGAQARKQRVGGELICEVW